MRQKEHGEFIELLGRVLVLCDCINYAINRLCRQLQYATIALFLENRLIYSIIT